MKINSVIVDDEKNSREVLRSLLEKFCPEVNVIGEASNVAEAYTLISTSKPDLVFLDIQMPRNNGFCLLQKFNPVPFSVIFITSYDHYAITAIKFSAIDYLLKPVETDDLKSAVTKAISKKKEVDHYIVNLLNNIDETIPNKKIPLHIHGNVRFINTFSITHIEADGSYSFIYCDGEKFVSSKSLKDFEDFLAPNLRFVRINKSIIINIIFLKEYSKGDPFIITLSTGDVFESSRRRKLDVLERLKTLS
jgi:two-component system LytT family response regulator